MAVQPPPPAESPESPSGGGLNLNIVLAALALVVIVAGVVLLALGGGKSHSTATTQPSASKYSGSLASPAQAEPPLSLRNYKGERVNITQYKGKAVLVTFLYTKCPDVCPIIAANLGAALNLMGPSEASKVQLIAVSVDFETDTPQAVGKFLKTHGVLGRMQYLVGSTPELARVWKAWGVGSEKDAKEPELVNHSGLVYGVSASGKVTTLYAANFTSREVAHDTPLLAAS
jgi:protein SCO1